MPGERNYIQIADAITSDVRHGILQPGDQLPPQREFAYDQKIASSTASRVYAELVRRGIAIGEVGRGTFIRAFNHQAPELGEPVKEPINMQLNFSVLSGQAADMTSGFQHLLRADVLEKTVMPVGAEGDYMGRKVAASLLNFDEWQANPDDILFTGGGRQGVAAAMTSVASPGDRIGIEYMTYPVIKGIAARMGLTLVPIEMDEHGLSVSSLIREDRKAPLKAIYFQPTLHNPLGVSMTRERQEELADYIKSQNIYVIEDVVYAFLAKGRPFARFAPEHTITVESLSKRLSPGLNFGFSVCPEYLREKYIASLRTGGWTTSGISYSACIRWISEGIVSKYEHERRKQARERQKIVKDILKDFRIETDPVSYHFWMYLPDGWRAESFCAAAADRGVAISPASVFTVTPGSSPNAIRVAIAPPSDEELIRGLKIIRNLAMTNENSFSFE